MTDSAPPLDFYFDFSSPYGYLMSEKIDALAAQYERKVRWHPILLGIIFKTTGSAPLTLQGPLKAAYYTRDFARSARFLGVPFKPPSHFPLPTQIAARAYYWLHGQDCALARQFAHADPHFAAIGIDEGVVSGRQRLLEARAAPACIISTAQHARPKVIGHSEPVFDQLISVSTEVVTKPSFSTPSMPMV